MFNMKPAGARNRFQPAGWGSNSEFEHSFGGKLRWLIRLQTALGSECCLPNNRVAGSAPAYRIDSRRPRPTARTPVTGNADRSRKMGLGNGCLLWFPVYTPIQRSWGLWPFTEGWEAARLFLLFFSSSSSSFFLLFFSFSLLFSFSTELGMVIFHGSCQAYYFCCFCF